MCKNCEKLLNVPVDKKATTVLFDETEKSYDVSEFVGIMQVNHKDDGTPYAFIIQDVAIKSTGRIYGIPLYIQYCPFCGEKLY